MAADQAELAAVGGPVEVDDVFGGEVGDLLCPWRAIEGLRPEIIDSAVRIGYTTAFAVRRIPHAPTAWPLEGEGLERLIQSRWKPASILRYAHPGDRRWRRSPLSNREKCRSLATSSSATVGPLASVDGTFIRWPPAVAGRRTPPSVRPVSRREMVLTLPVESCLKFPPLASMRQVLSTLFPWPKCP